ncbi:MAG TPA: AAA family ATPase [Caldilineaceae bacterium]|nr:AAA family ATPase [Caldilineaceae bacterium]
MSEEILPLIQAKNKLFLTGPFGSGKTTLAIERIRWLLAQERVRGDDILVLTPQRTVAEPYFHALRSGAMPGGAPVRVTTLAGLARHSVELYWPLLATVGGFADARREPTFLNLETSQYHMARFVDAAIARGEFDGIRIEHNRVVSQVLDNLNKAALQGFTIDEAYARLELAVPSGEQRTARLNALRAARQISHEFRALCHEKTLLDFSLQIDLFMRQVLTNEWSRVHLFRSHRHLIFDNVEEDTISAHQLTLQWLPELESALLVADADAGFRIFLGADPQGNSALRAVCDQVAVTQTSYIMQPALRQLTGRIEQTIGGQRHVQRAPAAPVGSVENPFDDGERGVSGGPATGAAESMATATDFATALLVPPVGFRFFPQMIDWTVQEIQRLVQEEEVPPGEIAVLAPFVSDAMRFSLQSRFAEVGIATTTHRPSRALDDEPAARTLLTLAKLAHPHWGMRPAATDVTLTLTLTIDSLDPVRAHLLSRIIYPERRPTIELGRFGELVTAMQERITYRLGEMYDRLRDWLYAYRANPDPIPLDQFFARLFGELLSQPGYGFHEDRDAARVANQLVESARNFRWALENVADGEAQVDLYTRLGREYVGLVEQGALGALYAPGWRPVEEAVFIAPAYTFLMRNQHVRYQFWLDIGSNGWWERLYQPLTHPYVLSQRWPADEPWSDFAEYTRRQETMQRLLLGLIRRTKQAIYLGISDYSESGFEQRGALLMLVNRLLTQERRRQQQNG